LKFLVSYSATTSREYINFIQKEAYMKTLRHLTIVLLLISGLSLNVQAQYNKYIEDIEEEYQEGDYDKALKRIEKMQKKVNKKLGNKNPYMAIALMKEAKINLELGLLNKVYEPLENALEMSKEVNDTLSAEHGFMLKEAAHIMLQYGNYKRAENFIARAEHAFKKSNSLIEDIKAELQVMKARVLVGKGFNRAAIDLVDDQYDYYRKRAFSADDKDLEEQRKTEFARLMTVRAEAYANMGDVDKATELFYENKNWIDEHLKKSHILYAWNTFLDVEMMKEHGLSLDAQADYYEDAFQWGVRKYEDTHWMVLLMNERLMSTLYRNNNKAKFNIAENFYKKAIKAFDKNSMHYLAREKMELELELADRDLGKLERNVNKLLTNPIVPKYHESRIELLEFAREVGLLTGKHKNTEAYELQILEIQEKLLGTDAPEYHLTKVRLANYYVDYTDKIEEARRTYENSYHGIVEPEITRKHEDYLDIQNHLAAFYEQTDKYGKASEILDDALLAAREKYDNTDMAYGHELDKIADLQIKIGEYEKAEENIELAIQILEDIKANRAEGYLASTLITQAKLFAIQGEYDKAEDNLYDSEKILDKAEVTLESSNLDQVDDRASLFLNVGRYSDAEELLSESLKEKQRQFGEESRHLNQPLVLMSRLHLIKGDYTAAEKEARRANNIAVSIFGDQSTKIVPSLLGLAEVYTTIGDYQKAERLLRNSIKIQRAQFGPDHVDVGKSTSQLALVNYYEGEPIDEVQDLFQKAEKIIGKSLGSNNPTYAEILKNMAVANISAGNYDQAENYLNLAKRIWAQKIGSRNNINAASISLLKGDIRYEQRRYGDAEDFYSDAQKQYRRVFSDEHPDYVKVQAKLSKAYYMQGDFKRSQDQMEEVLNNYKVFIRDYFPALSERQKAKFWNTIKPNYEFYNTLVISRNRTGKYLGELYNNALLTKALLLNSSIKIRQRIMSSNDEKLKTMYNDWIEKKELLTAALSMGSEQLAENGIDPNALATEVEALEKDLSERSEDFSQGIDNKPVSWENVQESLAENEVAIEMIRFRHFDHTFTDSVMYAVLYLKGNRRAEPELVLLSNGEELENKYLKNYRNRIKYKLNDTLSYPQFWKPIVDKIGTVASIYLSPDGVYNQINLEALQTPDGKYVLDNSNIILLSNTKDLYYDRLKPNLVTPQQVAQMYGNPDFYVDTSPGEPLPESGITRGSAEVISDLPGTKKELEELRELLNRKGWEVDSRTEVEATEPSIKKISNPRIFHVATHGFFQEQTVASSATEELNAAAAYENPLLKTGLLLAGAGDILNSTRYNYNVDDGILTAYEAMNLNLDKTDLVVLSACETGLGELEAGEGVYGLQRSFLVAGARTIIMSLFKVSDEATQELMVKFYRKWIETGRKRQSFIEAKKEIRNEYKDPIYWGPFIMIGLE